MCLGIPAQIVEVTDVPRKLAVAEVAGVRREVNLACVEIAGAPLDALIGTWVLIHAGFAMSVIDEAEAAETLKLLAQLGEAEQEAAAMRAAAAAVAE